MFACVVLGQLILAELLEFVGHRLLQAHRQRPAEALREESCGVQTDSCIPSSDRRPLGLTVL